ncbi:hypothetical protein Lalb_Chr17g0343001 [Lupinus albus]|uniref:Uncharacterized protein n=1 Tax=Lupinus albus TaxID=3870 RepID=A0A6A4P8U8_LUPAL|nr:hypothetical protein Lalb_Chr17g0343001 [Lupinus albus]
MADTSTLDLIKRKYLKKTETISYHDGTNCTVLFTLVTRKLFYISVFCHVFFCFALPANTNKNHVLFCLVLTYIPRTNNNMFKIT